jgi:hypothetical protein
MLGYSWYELLLQKVMTQITLAANALQNVTWQVETSEAPNVQINFSQHTNQWLVSSMYLDSCHCFCPYLATARHLS